MTFVVSEWTQSLNDVSNYVVKKPDPGDITLSSSQLETYYKYPLFSGKHPYFTGYYVFVILIFHTLHIGFAILFTVFVMFVISHYSLRCPCDKYTSLCTLQAFPTVSPTDISTLVRLRTGSTSITNNIFM